jgi:hypothetical protein
MKSPFNRLLGLVFILVIRWVGCYRHKLIDESACSDLNPRNIPMPLAHRY